MIRHLLKDALLLLFCFGCVLEGYTQGWENIYDNTNDYINTTEVVVTADSHYVAASDVLQWSPTLRHWLQLVKTDQNGNEIWNKEVFPPSPYFGFQFNDLTTTLDGGFALVGMFHEANGSLRHGILMKLDAQGDTLWTRALESSEFDILHGITPTPDGGYLLSGSNLGNAPHYWFVRKVDATGDLIWQYTFETPPTYQWNWDRAKKTVLLPNGNSLSLISMTGNILLVELDADGQLIAEYPLTNPYNFALVAGDLTLTPAGEALAGAFQIIVSGDNERLHASTMIWKLNNDMQEDWQLVSDSSTVVQWITSLSVNADNELFVGRLNAVEKRNSGTGELICEINADSLRPWGKPYVQALPEGEAIIATTYYPVEGEWEPSYLSLAKMTANCQAAQERIAGYAMVNLAEDCNSLSPGDSLSNWVVELRKDTLSFIKFTDSIGYFEFPVSPGEYTLTLHEPMHYWESCADTLPIALELGDTVIQELSALILEGCPFLVTDLSLGNPRPCFARTASIAYANLGPASVEDAYLELQLDSNLSITVSSHLYDELPGHLYRFELGTLSTTEIGRIQLSLLAACNPELIDSLTCLSATLYPQSACGDNNWDGPIIEINGTCNDEEVSFEVKNIGLGNMIGPQEIIVIEDDVMYFQTDFELDAGGSTTIDLPNANAVYAARAEQVPGYPFGDYAYDFVSHCFNPQVGTPFNNAFIGQFPYNETVPYTDTECRVYVNSYDPNQKVASPIGFGADHYIEPNTQLEYHIDFQNTGTDTAYTVVIRDTLSTHLNLLSMRPGGASHDFELAVENSHILVFTFDNINLVDSVTDEPLSHGFVAYSIQPKADLPNETRIENSAAIYFDFNPPIITNTTWHTIGREFLILDVDEPFEDLFQYDIYPNPVASGAILSFKDFEWPRAKLRLYNSLGQQVTVLTIENGRTVVNQQLSAGAYFFQLWAEGQLLGTGKLITQ